MRTSDNARGASSPISLGGRDLFFAREVRGKLTIHGLALHVLEGWVEGTPPDSMKEVLGMEDYDIVRRVPLSAANVDNVIAEEARRYGLEKLSSGATTP